MKTEQIVKALECCASGTCDGCAFYDPGEFGDIEKCTAALFSASLSLHREQEKRIEELTLEYAGFEAGAKDAAKFIKYATVRKVVDRLKDRYEFDCNADEDNALYYVDLCEWVERIEKELM